MANIYDPLERLIAHQEILEANYQNQLKAYEIAQSKQKQLESLSNNLTTILTFASSINLNWNETTVSSWLTGLTPYTDRDDSVEQLAINVRKATILAKEIGLFLPEFDLFALAEWLQDNLPLKLAEAHLVLDRAKNAKTAMVEANSAWQTFQRNAAKESKLKQEQQKISDSIRNRQQQITTLHECSNVVHNIVSELDSSIKLHLLQIFRELQPGSGKFANYVQIESSFDSEQKLLEERKVTIESDYQAKKENYKEAKQTEGEIESLKTDLEDLLEKVPGVNWYEPNVINLLARLQPYIDKEKSARGLTENILNEIREIAIEFGIFRPEYQLLGLVGLHNGISTQLPSIQTALSLAQDAASTMAKVDSVEQTSTENENLIAQLQSEKLKIPQKRIEFQKELNRLNLQKSNIDLAINDLHEWSGTAYLKLHEAFERCFQQQQSLTEYSLQLPFSFIEIVNTERANSKPWETCLRSGNNKLNKLIAQCHEWEEVLKIFRLIDSMIQEGKNLVNVNTQTLSSNTVDEFFDAIAEEINSLNPLRAIKKLQNRTQTTLVQIQQKLGTWNQHWQFINYQQRRVLLRAELRAIAWHCNAIVKQNKPKELESILRQITNEIINSVFNKSQQFLARTNTEIDRKIKEIPAGLNELENDELRISRQISTAQESVEKARNERQYNFTQVSILLRQVKESPILPEPLHSIAEQNLQLSDIRRLAPQFLEQINYYQYRFNQLEVLLPKINPFSVLSNVNYLITVNLDNRRKNTESLSQDIENDASKIQDIDVRLQQNLENLKAQRSRVKIEIEELLDQLAEQLNEQTSEQEKIHQQILVIEEQVKTSKRETELKIETVVKLWKEISGGSQVLSQLQAFLSKCLQNPNASISDASQLSSLIQTYENHITKLENLIPQLNPFPVLSKIKSKIEVALQQQQKTTAEAFKRLEDSQAQLNEIKVQLQQQKNAIEKNRNEGTNNSKLQRGLNLLSKAEKDRDFLGPALVCLHGALEDYFRYWLASNPSVPLSEREAFNYGEIKWIRLLNLMQQYGDLNKNQRDYILNMNKLRNEVAHGRRKYPETRSQLEEYADFVRDIIVNGI